MDDTLTHERADDRDLLVTFLRGRDVECGVCRYNLRNATADKCPECGVAIRLTVSSPRRLGWWIVCMFVSAATFGFTAIAVGGMIVSAIRYDYQISMFKPVFSVGSVAFVSGLSSLLAMRLLRRWPSFSPMNQRITALGWVIFHAAMIAALFLYL